MTNIISYNKFPDKVEFCEMYKHMSQRALAEHYGCNKLRIRKWIDHFGLQRRTRGGGNNRKYDINCENLKSLILSGYSNQDIMSLLNIDSRSSLYKWLNKFNIKRPDTRTEYQKYCRKVRHLTEMEYDKYINIINPHKHKRTLCGVDGGYQLDHIRGVSECFKSGVSVEECSSKDNLQMIPWKENLNKRIFHKI